ncbi:MAG: HAMP domain-containing histidine kinase [Anaerolineae bacterium]|nr:HAMP domain-containing histidine kinase [Anaerolineae bacterium]
MSEQPTSPLQQARLAVQKLREAATVDPVALKTELAAIEALLQQAAARGEGENTGELRARLESTVEQFARLNSLMVHEIRKPMTSIRGYSDMLAKPGMVGTLNEMQQNFMDVIRKNVIGMEGLVTNISDLNKIVAGRMRLDPKMTTFGQVLMEAQKTVEPLVAEHHHTMTYDVPQGMPILNVDTAALVKVLGQVLRNAIMYTPTGGAVTLKAERLEGNRMRVTVRDTGVGMKAEDIKRLGEPFFRGDHELVTSQKGYGLGIPVAMGFLKMMDSEFKLESVPDQGTVVSFEIVGMG